MLNFSPIDSIVTSTAYYTIIELRSCFIFIIMPLNWFNLVTLDK